MSDEVSIFISYAHDDDLTLSPSRTNRVSSLSSTRCSQEAERSRRDARQVWRDRKRISDGDQFDGMIDDGLKKARILVVVMSNNWLDRPYCRKELDEFIELRKAAGADNVGSAWSWSERATSID